MAVNKFPVEGSHIMMFARSIADDNPVSYTHLTLPTKA